MELWIIDGSPYNSKVLLRLFLTTLLFSLRSYAQSDWNDPFPPHRIADGLYYVGSKGLSTYLITTKGGHILINASFERTVPIIRKNVEQLGFKMTDVKILLSSHAHDDHVGGLALLKELTGAKVYVMQQDADVTAKGGEGQYLYKGRWKPVKVDKLLKDREQVSLAGTTLTAHLTPGHTPGCTTWTMTARDGANVYNVVIVGSPNVNPGYKLVNNTEYPEISSDFARTFRVLKSLSCDIFLGAHGSYYDMERKVLLLGRGSANPFVDPEGYRNYLDDREKHYLKTLAEQEKSAR